MENIVGFIFARGGSKGVPGKNLRSLAGKPLLVHAIHCAQACRSLQRIIVSTDCPKIAETALAHGAEVPFLRPPELACDEAPERLAWRHAILEVEARDKNRVDVLVSIPPTCPLRLPKDIDHCVDSLLESDADIMLTATEINSNPYFNMITQDDQGRAHLVLAPDGDVLRRQDAPRVHGLTAVAYAARRDALFTYDTIFQSRASAVLIPSERAVDIDTELDLSLAELIMDRRQRPDRAYRPAA
ncbi:MAG: acylneuraminate cytidylyltransferase family protein [Pirellulales bacterium]|nr:acylneuraminate cytidylyltransferase family protein [Pirellulales bacterium]